MSAALRRFGSTLERAGTDLVTAVVRAFVVVVVFVGSLSDQPFIENHESFPFILAAAAIWAAIALWLAHSERPVPLAWASLIDLAFVAGLMLASGGAFADVRLAFFVFPVIAAVTAGPRTTARWASIALVVYVVVSLLHDPGDLPGRDATAATFSAYLIGIGVISIGISELLRRRSQRIEALAETSRTLAVRALEAEERERRRLAFALHDEPIQQLLGAQLELDRATRGDLEAAADARAAVKEAIAQLRETIFDLYPSSLEQLGLPAALEQLASRATERSDAEIELELDYGAAGDELEPLLFTLARELLRNAVEHAEADRIEVRLTSADGHLALEVADDGRGMVPGRAQEALGEGHLGIASVRARAEALGGGLEIDSAPGEGTRAIVSLPIGAGGAPGREQG